MAFIKIFDREIGPGRPCFIIAEAGVNHNGHLDTAKGLVEAAAAAGVDAVKFQTYRARDLVIPASGMAHYQRQNQGNGATQLEMLQKLELDYQDFGILEEYCRQLGIIFLSTPHTFEAAEFLADLVPAFKVGSGDLTNLPFLKVVGALGKPVLLGTGMSTLGEVKTALRALYRTGNRQVVMLHCTTSYPCPPADVNLAAMQTLMRELDCLVGYSDHTLGIQVPPMAVSLGAVVIEKHFTLSRDLPGPDHKASLNPEELKAMVRALRGPGPVAIPTEIMGSPEKRPTAREQEIMEVVRKSIVAAKDIPAGETVDQGMVGIKRPATGISPVHWDAILGKKTVKNIKKDSVIKWDDLENAT